MTLSRLVTAPIDTTYWRYWFIIAALLILGGFSLYVDGYELILPLILLICIGVAAMILYPREVFFGLFVAIPISSEIELPGGLGTDLPGELLLWALSTLTAVLIAAQGLHKRLWHPISALLVLQLLWMLVATIFAEHPVFASKFLVAKLWYILPLFILPHYLIKSRRDIDIVIDCFIAGVTIGAVYFFIKHSLEGFDFEARVTAGKPLWRNHVNYACTLVCTLPMLWYRYLRSHRWIYIIIGFFLLSCIYFAYARVAYLCIAAAIGYSLVLRWRLTLPVAALGLLTIGLFTYQAIKDEAYVKYAPQYERAITQGDFSSKVGSTFNGQDISTMERVHRWVAGSRMVGQGPITGVGPSNFYSTYKPYTIFSFETYVSDNPEHSGIHNYYLMTLVEQGWVGLLLLVGLLIVALYRIERRYHLSAQREKRQLLMMVGSMLAMIITLNLINDMLEVIKIGGLLFFLLFVIVYLDQQETSVDS